MIYACQKCRFVFYRIGKISDCPMCDSPKLRPATMAEQEKLKQQIQKEREEKER